ncbi:MAG: NADPH-dependent FMN reductase [Pirellulales bacterium]|jgi:chromate reductase
MNAPKIIAFAGSARKDSFNKALVKIAAKGAEQEGATVTLLDLKDYPLPLFDEDLEKEQGTPENAVKLKQLFASHDGYLIASPEYNSSISPLLKNTIDWASRPAEGEPPMIAYKGKTAAIMATSPGGLGGLRGLTHVRSILSSIGVLMLPEQIAVPSAYQAFDDSGNLKDEKQQQRVEGLGKLLATMIAKLND